jgi:DNA-binding PadR family transcriptional regulator
MINGALDIGTLETEMNRGFLHLLVLAILENEMYGYAMVKHIESLGYKVEENTLYTLLRRHEKNGWITSRWDLSEDRPRQVLTPLYRGTRHPGLTFWYLGNSKQQFWTGD